MKIREINLTHEYNRLCEWWKWRGLTPPAKIILDGAHGVMATEDGRDLLAAWIYLFDRGTVAMIEWAIASPDLPLRLVVEAMNTAYEFLEGFAKENGYLVVFTSTQLAGGMESFLKRRDWRSCKGMPHAHFMKEVA